MRFLLLILLFCASCAPSIRVDYDQSGKFNIQRYKSYSWMEVCLDADPNRKYYTRLNDQRIKEAVDTHLRQKGLSKQKEQNDMLVRYHILLERKDIILPDPCDENIPWILSDRHTHTYLEGTLIIDFVDVASDALVWRGWAMGVLDNADQHSLDKIVNRAVEKIFKKLPDSNGVTPR